ncbi:T9SS type A sorting domain-containing protein [uncultured Aquimarina sp.]|uniref:T9SS type A sorting domain-containing protein n=1 Tax=uncultured Aquimarina sp. TaxID=575652 RepID=UPI00262C9D20|nr:T9SS type A sorting domain-containing protein [uncultured Aquimarina sp.]
MKTHRSFLLLLIIFTSVAYAQDESFVTGNKINMVISVTDVPRDDATHSTQKLEMIVPDSLKLNKKDIKLRVVLDYKSVIDTVRYFRLSKTVVPGAPLGASLPVIIPPIKKPNDPSEPSDSFSSSNGYPYLFNNPLHFHLKKHKLYLSLIEYDTEEDYLKDEFGLEGVVRDEKVINISLINRESKELIIDNLTKNSFLLYPNPFDNQVTIDISNKKTSEQIKVDVFSINGIKVISYNLGNAHKNNQQQYILDTSHLKKGVYYCYVTEGSTSYYKTILKE